MSSRGYKTKRSKKRGRKRRQKKQNTVTLFLDPFDFAWLNTLFARDDIKHNFDLAKHCLDQCAAKTSPTSQPWWRDKHQTLTPRTRTSLELINFAQYCVKAFDSYISQAQKAKQPFEFTYPRIYELMFSTPPLNFLFAARGCCKKILDKIVNREIPEDSRSILNVANLLKTDECIDAILEDKDVTLLVETIHRKIQLQQY